MNTACLRSRVDPPAIGRHRFGSGHEVPASSVLRRDLVDRRVAAGSAGERRCASAPVPENSPDDDAPARLTERSNPSSRQFCPLAVPSVGFVQSRFTPSTAPSVGRLDRHTRIKRGRAAAVLDYCAAAFVLGTLVFGPVLGWLIFE
jgi:hypothetical protein